MTRPDIKPEEASNGGTVASSNTHSLASAPDVPAGTGPGAPNPISGVKATLELVLAWVSRNSGFIAAATSAAVGASFALVTVYYTRLLQRLGTTPSAAGFDNQELVARALVGFVFLVPLFSLLFYWIWLWIKPWTGSEWRARLSELALCELILILVAAYCAIRHSQLQDPVAGLAAIFPLLCLASWRPMGIYQVPIGRQEAWAAG